MIKQLIFDCDGVLVDSEVIAAEVMVNLLNKYGIPITNLYYLQHCTGKTFTGLKCSLSNEYGVTLPENFVQMVTEKAEAANRERLEPVNGIMDLLDRLGSIPKAVASNSNLRQINASLAKTDISPHFGEFIFSSQQVQNPKPSPEIYLYAADALEVRPEDFLVIEDSITGVTAALAAGMEVIGFLAGRHIVAGHDIELRKAGVEKLAYTAIALKEIIDKSI